MYNIYNIYTKLNEYSDGGISTQQDYFDYKDFLDTVWDTGEGKYVCKSDDQVKEFVLLGKTIFPAGLKIFIKGLTIRMEVLQA